MFFITSRNTDRGNRRAVHVPFVNEIIIYTNLASIGQLALLSVLLISSARAHDPVFAMGPHVVFKGGVRFRPTAYDEPDKVWLVELNGES